MVVEAGDPGIVAELGLVQQLLRHSLREQVIVQIDLPLGTNQCCGSGSESFYHQAKVVRKKLIPTVLSLKTDVNVPSKVISEKTFYKN